MPTCDCPPSIIKPIFSPRLSSTCCAFVGEILPDKFALGAANGKSQSQMTA